MLKKCVSVLLVLLAVGFAGTCGYGMAKLITKFVKGDGKWEAYCIHPLIAGGNPFPLDPNAKFKDGKLWTADGSSYALGAQCVFARPEKQ